jgi:hypothetical protein
MGIATGIAVGMAAGIAVGIAVGIAAGGLVLTGDFAMDGTGLIVGAAFGFSVLSFSITKTL